MSNDKKINYNNSLPKTMNDVFLIPQPQKQRQNNIGKFHQSNRQADNLPKTPPSNPNEIFTDLSTNPIKCLSLNNIINTSTSFNTSLAMLSRKKNIRPFSFKHNEDINNIQNSSGHDNTKFVEQSIDSLCLLGRKVKRDFSANLLEYPYPDRDESMLKPTVGGLEHLREKASNNIQETETSFYQQLRVEMLTDDLIQLSKITDRNNIKIKKEIYKSSINNWGEKQPSYESNPLNHSVDNEDEAFEPGRANCKRNRPIKKKHGDSFKSPKGQREDKNIPSAKKHRIKHSLDENYLEVFNFNSQKNVLKDNVNSLAIDDKNSNWSLNCTPKIVVNNNELNCQNSCKHLHCDFTYKSHKQWLFHHDKMETECKAEKHMLVKLIKYYKVVLARLISEGKVDITSYIDYLKLKEQHKATEENLTDIDYFYCLPGKDFEKIPKADLNKIEIGNDSLKANDMNGKGL
jgi:hypothetical protein